ncbi:hypothetical protein JCM24511_09126 [Saitozyma sp. JCM 24511]|nr:hypothetical protein JCM24511_09126 [Saitozyma sp. JCM 24511]
MSKKGLTRHQVSSGLTYVAQKPAFLQNFGQATATASASGPSDRGGRGGRGGDEASRDGREPLPERPREGRWASGSDDEERHGGRAASGSEDEWGEVYGGGGEDGPQVVVLKEGRHLSAEEVRRERRRAAGKPSQSPPPQQPTTAQTAASGPSAPTSAPSLAKPRLHAKPNTSKRKLVGAASTASGGDDDAEAEIPDKAAGDKTKGVGRSKKKKVKGMLSFNEAEGED